MTLHCTRYETIESEAAKIWKVQWCAVVVEFRHKQPLPNPFSLIWYFVFSVRWVVTQLQCKQCAPCMQEEEGELRVFLLPLRPDKFLATLD